MGTVPVVTSGIVITVALVPVGTELFDEAHILTAADTAGIGIKATTN